VNAEHNGSCLLLVLMNFLSYNFNSISGCYLTPILSFDQWHVHCPNKLRLSKELTTERGYEIKAILFGRDCRSALWLLITRLT
jgi:hypothetical protein